MSLDIRKYEKNKDGLSPIDASLVERVITGLQSALLMQNENKTSMALTAAVSNSSSAAITPAASTSNDVIVAATDSIISLSSMSIGGPSVQMLSSFCRKLPVSMYRKFVGNLEKFCTGEKVNL